MLLSPSIPTTPAGIAAITNGDGTRNFTVALPSVGSGANVGLSIGSVPSFVTGLTPSTAALYGYFSSVGGTSLLSYAPPSITQVTLTKPVFIAANGTGTGGAGNAFTTAVPCPFAANDPQWSCSDGSLLALTIDGSNFAADPAVALGRVTRALLLGSNATGMGVTYTGTGIIVGSWSHSRIVAYTRQAQGWVRVQLTSTGYYGEINTQAVNASYKDFSPSVSGLQGATTGIPTEGYAPGDWSNPLVIEARHLEAADDLTVTVGNRTCPIFCPLRNDTCASAAELKVQVIDSVPIVTDTVWMIKCRAPPGQGLSQPVQLFKTVSGTVSPSAAVATVDYAPPTLTAVSV